MNNPRPMGFILSYAVISLAMPGTQTSSLIDEMSNPSPMGVHSRSFAKSAQNHNH